MTKTPLYDQSINCFDNDSKPHCAISLLYFVGVVQSENLDRGDRDCQKKCPIQMHISMCNMCSPVYGHIGIGEFEKIDATAGHKTNPINTSIAIVHVSAIIYHDHCTLSSMTFLICCSNSPKKEIAYVSGKGNRGWRLPPLPIERYMGSVYPRTWEFRGIYIFDETRKKVFVFKVGIGGRRWFRTCQIPQRGRNLEKAPDRAPCT